MNLIGRSLSRNSEFFLVACDKEEEKLAIFLTRYWGRWVRPLDTFKIEKDLDDKYKYVLQFCQTKVPKENGIYINMLNLI